MLLRTFATLISNNIAIYVSQTAICSRSQEKHAKRNNTYYKTTGEPKPKAQTACCESEPTQIYKTLDTRTGLKTRPTLFSLKVIEHIKNVCSCSDFLSLRVFQGPGVSYCIKQWRHVLASAGAHQASGSNGYRYKRACVVSSLFRGHLSRLFGQTDVTYTMLLWILSVALSNGWKEFMFQFGLLWVFFF